MNTVQGTTQARAPSPLRRLLRPEFADFWHLWSVGLVVFSVRGLETVAIGVFVYQRTNSAFLVAMMTMLRLVPMGLFGVFLGARAERIERRSTLIAVVLLPGANSATLGLLALGGQLEVWHLALSSFVNSLDWATDNPVRRAMIGNAPGPGHGHRPLSFDGSVGRIVVL